ncbi:MAG: DNA-processing protein DprA [Eubacterium sp.]|nr:DNA-processing protein DprA [Eubacterium sp.]
MERYYIALQELGAKNELLLKIITEYHPSFINNLFENNSEIFFSNMEWLQYKFLFDDEGKISAALKRADEILRINTEEKIHTTLYSAINYPKNLMSIDNPPAIIYYKGANPNEGYDKAIASVGTRMPTSFGFNAINYLIPQWVNEGFSIISGLADGIDWLSHIACLAAGGKTLAVLAHGLDTVYPTLNKKLAERILLCGGTLLSEYPVGTKPTKFRFVRRNRLIVGLSKVTIAMECAEKSGSMRTIEFAQRQHCPVFCPFPGVDPEESQSGLQYILDNKIGKEIVSGTDYEKVIFAAGFALERPKLAISYIKKQYLRALIIGAENQNIIKTVLEKIGLSYTLECACETNLNNYLLDYIQISNYSIDNIIKEFVDTMIFYAANKKEK